jgi:hypothetical protein
VASLTCAKCTYFETARYQDFCAASLADIDDIVVDWVASPGFDQLLVQAVGCTCPGADHDQVVDHVRGMLARWVHDESTPRGP